MKRWLVPLIILGVIVLGLYRWAVGFNNSAIDKQEVAKTRWADVQSAYQRRMDLIPNLVETVKGYAKHEKETLEAVINARSNATKTQINAGDLTPEKMKAFQQAQGSLSSALSRLMVVVERYPDLKANQNFMELQSQLEGTENRINVARDRFNEAVRVYNTYIRHFPNSILAGLFHFDRMSPFEAQAGAENAPKVDFSK